jgi:TonB-dependent starch-binding outer membrane protein SusC
MYCERLLKAIVLPCLLLLTLTGFSQEKIISGKVTDSKDGSGIPGVSVSAKDGSAGTQTGTDGTFRITVRSSVTVLIISSVGYATQEVSIDGRSTIDVQLVISNATLGEVIVSTGYGTARKKDLTGSITQISSKDFQKGPQTTPLQLIQGKVPGVQISTGNGMPGAGIYIRIRQGASLNASNDPLIVVDGVPLETGGISGVANPLTLLNPNDIESMNILKDASATAIYGNRASNGVIIITTKKGLTGKLKISYNNNVTLSTVTKLADILNADEFRDLVNAKGTPAQKALLTSGSTDWQNQIYRDAISHDHNISFTGGIKKLPYRLSLGYLNQDGILKKDNLQRGTLVFNINPRMLKNHLSIDINMKNSVTRSRFANQGAIGAAVFFDPTKPMYDLSKPQYGGYWEWELNGLPNTLAPKNPLSLIEQNRNVGNTYRSIGNVQFDYKFHFLPELRANLNLGYDVSKGSGSSVTLPTSASSFYNQGSKSRYMQKRWNYLSDFYLNYAKNYTSIKSRVDFTIGYGWQDWTVYSPGFPTVNGTGVIPAGPPFKSQHTLLSMFSRLNYGFDERYLITATVRRDGSSRFSEDNRWGWFPSAAFAWRISRESFLMDSKTISDLKLRIGWGITGQQDVGSDYPYLARYTQSDSSGMYQFGSNYYLLLRPEGYDENLKWETTETYNAGIDVGLFNNRVSFSVDAYFKKTEDLLAVISVPAGSNLTNQILTNVGNIENKGLEFTLNATPVRTKDFTWDLSYNFTYNESEITNLSKIKDPNAIGNLVGGISGGVGNTIQIHTVGYAPYSFYVYKQVYDQNDKPIEGLYVDLNKDAMSNDNDKYRYKNPQPKYFMGLSSQLAYKKWSLNFAARASFDNYMYNNFNSNSGTYQNFSFANYLGNVSRDVLHTGFTVPRLWSDYYIENASFVRLDNVNLGYNVGRIGKNTTMRLSANVQNVFVITKYSGLDPEIPGGIDNNFYPRPRTYSLGVNLDF